MGKIDAIVLAGGLGTRLRGAVDDVPKVLAPVNGRPFLDIILASLDRSGLVKKVILAVGYMADKIIAHYKNADEYKFKIDFSLEERPMGTGGGIKNAVRYSESEDILALNGDSFVDVDLEGFRSFHDRTGGELTMVLKKVGDAGRFGNVIIGTDHRIISFEEKKASAPGLINAGMYLFKRKLFDAVEPDKACSIEKDLFPLFLKKNVYGYISDGKFIDIGIPETYKVASEYLKEIC